jgi:hypothetical protein
MRHPLKIGPRLDVLSAFRILLGTKALVYVCVTKGGLVEIAASITESVVHSARVATGQRHISAFSVTTELVGMSQALVSAHHQQPHTTWLHTHALLRSRLVPMPVSTAFVGVRSMFVTCAWKMLEEQSMAAANVSHTGEAKHATPMPVHASHHVSPALLLTSACRASRMQH